MTTIIPLKVGVKIKVQKRNHCTVRRKPYCLDRWRMPIRAGSVIFPQASQAALFILYAYGVISLFSGPGSLNAMFC